MVDDTKSADIQRVLVVPDDLLRLELGNSFLDRRSFRVRTAAGATEAVAIAAVWRPSLIVVSSELPDMPIPKFCNTLRTNPTQQLLKLLMITETLGELHEGIIPPDVDGHLVSPVLSGQLLQTISELLQVPQRIARRVPVNALGKTTGLSHEQHPPDLGNVLWISGTGLILESSRILDEGCSGQISFSLPHGAQQLHLTCVVRALLDEVRLIYALDFVETSQQDIASITAYVTDELQRGGHDTPDAP